MAILNVGLKAIKAMHNIVEQHIIDIPDLNTEQKKAVKKALGQAFMRGAEYGVQISRAAGEGFGQGVIKEAKKGDR